MSGTWYDTNGIPLDPNAPTGAADSYVGGTSDDSVDAGAGNDVLIGGLGNDTLIGGADDDLLVGNEDDDSLVGGAGNDDLSGGAGNDILDGGEGDDRLNGIPGDDTIYGGSGSDTVDLAGFPSNYTWQWIDTFGGWKVTDTTGNDGVDYIYGDVEYVSFGETAETVATPCFAAGTRILTASGEVPVEALRAGDLVVTMALQGACLRPVRWVGRRQVDAVRHPHPETVLPIRIEAGALGAGVPCRDLRVSPDHAIYVDGVLVPAASLVDGVSIRQEAWVGRVTYFHIEIDAHDVIFADGAPAETWLDCGNRAQFENGGLVTTLYPDFTATAPRQAGCAPRVTEGEQLDRIRLRLPARVSQDAPRRRRA